MSMWPVPSLRRLASHAVMMWWRDSPASFGPSPMGIRTLVDSRSESRRPLITSPVISSASPPEYTSAVSIRFTPASRHMSTWRRAPLASVAPTARNPPRPPKVIVPSVSADTRRPLRPSWRYSIGKPPCARPSEFQHTPEGPAELTVATGVRAAVLEAGWRMVARKPFPEGAHMSASVTAAAAGKVDVGGDLTVNRLGFGAMRITGEGIWGEPPDRDRAKAALRRALELDINFIDTADSYGPDVSETLIAEALYPYPDDLVIATKGGLLRPGPGRWEPDGRPEHLRKVCEGSLARLRVDRIDLYQFHRPDPKVPIAESIGALAELKREGKIRHIGVSNVTEEQLREAEAITAVVSVQNRYNVADRSSEPMLDLCDLEMV